METSDIKENIDPVYNFWGENGGFNSNAVQEYLSQQKLLRAIFSQRFGMWCFNIIKIGPWTIFLYWIFKDILGIHYLICRYYLYDVSVYLMIIERCYGGLFSHPIRFYNGSWNIWSFLTTILILSWRKGIYNLNWRKMIMRSL